MCCKTSACYTQKTYVSFLIVTLCVFINRECLKGTIVNSRDAEVSCPEACESKLQDREIKAVIVTLFPLNSCNNVAIVTVNRHFIVIAAPE